MTQSRFDREGDRRRAAAKDLFEHGRAALQAGDRARARRLLEQAVVYDRDHSGAWLWLSAAADDPDEQKQFLEWAIAADPGNTAARRGLALLTGRIDPADLLPEGGRPAPSQPAEAQAARLRREFKCPRCGAQLRFDPELVDLKCDSCGFVEVVAEVPAAGQEQVLDFDLPTRQGHRWAESQSRFTCQQCGANTLLSAGQTSSSCPFCGSSAIVAAAEEADLLYPQGVIPMGCEAPAAQAAVRAWLGRGLFAPDDLDQLARSSGLRPVYVPFWTFNGSLEAHWRGRAAEGSGSSRRWIWRTGERIFFFTNQLQPGVKELPARLLVEVQPFDLDQLVVYQPEYLAAWPAAAYDISLADASLAGRAAMIADAKKQLSRKAASGGRLVDFEITRTSFSGQTYKLILLPLWVGAYRYRGQLFQVLVNGQTRRVAGRKPADRVKVAMAAVSAVAVLILLGAVVFGAWQALGLAG